jgi:hypothetical protein
MLAAVRRSWLDVGGVVVGVAAIAAALALLVAAFVAPPASPADPARGSPDHGRVDHIAGPASSAGLDHLAAQGGPHGRLTPVVPGWSD